MLLPLFINQGLCLRERTRESVCSCLLFQLVWYLNAFTRKKSREKNVLIQWKRSTEKKNFREVTRLTPQNVNLYMWIVKPRTMACINSAVDVVIKSLMEVPTFTNTFNNKQGGDGRSLKWKILAYDNLFVKLHIIARIYISSALLVKFNREKGFFLLWKLMSRLS